MNNFKLTLISTLALVGASFGTVISGSSLQGILDSHTDDGLSSINVNTDQVNPDAYWNITASKASIATMIIELAGYAGSNTFGVYDAGNILSKVQLFNGAATGGLGGTTTTLKIDGAFKVSVNNLYQTTFSGKTFGYYLSGPGGTFYSDNNLNEGKSDHMVAFQGKNDGFDVEGGSDFSTWTPNEYVLGWEDVAFPGADSDYNDMVLMVESVKPVPEPTTIGLMGLGLIGVFAAARRRKA